MAGVQISRRASYRLLRKVRTESEKLACKMADMDAPHKLREPVLQWLKDYCRAAPSIPSHEVQQALENRFGIRVSVSHLNATRTALGLPSRMPPLREKNWMGTQKWTPIGKKEQGDSCW